MAAPGGGGGGGGAATTIPLSSLCRGLVDVSYEALHDTAAATALLPSSSDGDGGGGLAGGGTTTTTGGGRWAPSAQELAAAADERRAQLRAWVGRTASLATQLYAAAVVTECERPQDAAPGAPQGVAAAISRARGARAAADASDEALQVALNAAGSVQGGVAAGAAHRHEVGPALGVAVTGRYLDAPPTDAVAGSGDVAALLAGAGAGSSDEALRRRGVALEDALQPLGGVTGWWVGVGGGGVTSDAAGAAVSSGGPQPLLSVLRTVDRALSLAAGGGGAGARPQHAATSEARLRGEGAAEGSGSSGGGGGVGAGAGSCAGPRAAARLLCPLPWPGVDAPVCAPWPGVQSDAPAAPQHTGPAAGGAAYGAAADGAGPTLPLPAAMPFLRHGPLTAQAAAPWAVAAAEDGGTDSDAAAAAAAAATAAAHEEAVRRRIDAAISLRLTRCHPPPSHLPFTSVAVTRGRLVLRCAGEFAVALTLLEGGGGGGGGGGEEPGGGESGGVGGVGGVGPEVVAAATTPFPTPTRACPEGRHPSGVDHELSPWAVVSVVVGPSADTVTSHELAGGGVGGDGAGMAGDGDGAVVDASLPMLRPTQAQVGALRRVLQARLMTAAATAAAPRPAGASGDLAAGDGGVPSDGSPVPLFPHQPVAADPSLGVAYDLLHGFAAQLCLTSLAMQAQALATAQPLPGAHAHAPTAAASSGVVPSGLSGAFEEAALAAVRGRGAPGSRADWGGGRVRGRFLPDSRRMLLSLWPWGGMHAPAVPPPDGRLLRGAPVASGSAHAATAGAGAGAGSLRPGIISCVRSDADAAAAALSDAAGRMGELRGRAASAVELERDRARRRADQRGKGGGGGSSASGRGGRSAGPGIVGGGGGGDLPVRKRARAVSEGGGSDEEGDGAGGAQGGAGGGSLLAAAAARLRADSAAASASASASTQRLASHAHPLATPALPPLRRGEVAVCDEWGGVTVLPAPMTGAAWGAGVGEIGGAAGGSGDPVSARVLAHPALSRVLGLAFPSPGEFREALRAAGRLAAGRGVARLPAGAGAGGAGSGGARATQELRIRVDPTTGALVVMRGATAAAADAAAARVAAAGAAAAAPSSASAAAAGIGELGGGGEGVGDDAGSSADSRRSLAAAAGVVTLAAGAAHGGGGSVAPGLAVAGCGRGDVGDGDAALAALAPLLQPQSHAALPPPATALFATLPSDARSLAASSPLLAPLAARYVRSLGPGGVAVLRAGAPPLPQSSAGRPTLSHSGIPASATPASAAGHWASAWATGVPANPERSRAGFLAWLDAVGGATGGDASDDAASGGGAATGEGASAAAAGQSTGGPGGGASGGGGGGAGGAGDGADRDAATVAIDVAAAGWEAAQCSRWLRGVARAERRAANAAALTAPAASGGGLPDDASAAAAAAAAAAAVAAATAATPMPSPRASVATGNAAGSADGVDDNYDDDDDDDDNSPPTVFPLAWRLLLPPKRRLGAAAPAPGTPGVEEWMPLPFPVHSPCLPTLLAWAAAAHNACALVQLRERLVSDGATAALLTAMGGGVTRRPSADTPHLRVVPWEAIGLSPPAAAGALPRRCRPMQLVLPIACGTEATELAVWHDGLSGSLCVTLEGGAGVMSAEAGDGAVLLAAAAALHEHVVALAGSHTSHVADTQQFQRSLLNALRQQGVTASSAMPVRGDAKERGAVATARAGIGRELEPLLARAVRDIPLLAPIDCLTGWAFSPAAPRVMAQQQEISRAGGDNRIAQIFQRTSGPAAVAVRDARVSDPSVVRFGDPLKAKSNQLLLALMSAKLSDAAVDSSMEQLVRSLTSVAVGCSDLV